MMQVQILYRLNFCFILLRQTNDPKLSTSSQKGLFCAITDGHVSVHPTCVVVSPSLTCEATVS